MSKTTKLVYFQIVDGTADEVQQLQKALEPIKKKVDMEFLIGNERIELRDVKYLLDSLYALYKQVKERDEKQGK